MQTNLIWFWHEHAIVYVRLDHVNQQAIAKIMLASHVTRRTVVIVILLLILLHLCLMKIKSQLFVDFINSMEQIQSSLRPLQVLLCILWWRLIVFLESWWGWCSLVGSYAIE